MSALRQLCGCVAAYYRNTLSPASIGLKRCSYREAESLSRFPEQVLRRECALVKLIAEFTRRAIRPRTSREHTSCDRHGSLRKLVQPHRVVSVIDSERSVDHRQEHLKFEPGGRSWLPAGSALDRQVPAELEMLLLRRVTIMRDRVLNRTSVGQ